MIKKYRRLSGLLAALTITSGVVLPSAGASAAAQEDKLHPVSAAGEAAYSLPEGFTSYPEFRAVQDQLRLTAAALTAAGARDPSPGYTGIELSPARRSVVLYWRGPLPPSLSEVITHQKAHVEVRQARYTHLQLIDQARKLGRTSRHGAVSIVRVAVPADGSALQVGVSGPAELARRTLTADVDLAVTQEQAAKPLSTRADDADPYWGGARSFNMTEVKLCTTGFAVRTSTGTALLTAGHCGSIGNTFMTGAGQQVGQATLKDTIGDTLLISASAGGRVYDGDAWSSSSRPVAGTAVNYVGDYMCTLGAFSGTRCDVVVQGIDEYRSGPDGLRGPLVRAEQLQHTSAGGDGDSGGPVISLTGRNWSLLMANGTISQGDPATQVGCTGVTQGSCYWRIWYADINRTLSQYGASIVIGP